MFRITDTRMNRRRHSAAISRTILRTAARPFGLGPVAYLLGGLACQSKGVLELKQLERDVHLSLPGLRLGLITIHAVRGVPRRRRLLDFHHVVALAPDDLDPLLRGPDRTR